MVDLKNTRSVVIWTKPLQMVNVAPPLVYNSSVTLKFPRWSSWSIFRYFDSTRPSKSDSTPPKTSDNFNREVSTRNIRSNLRSHWKNKRDENFVYEWFCYISIFLIFSKTMFDIYLDWLTSLFVSIFGKKQLRAATFQIVQVSAKTVDANCSPELSCCKRNKVKRSHNTRTIF